MKKYRILAIDDNTIVLKSIKKVLEADCYHVTLAEGGDKAINILADNTFDLVITELLMDEIDGLEVLRKIKETNPLCMSMILTGYGHMHEAIPALGRHVDAYLEKPCEVEKLFTQVEKCLKKLELKKKR